MHGHLNKASYYFQNFNTIYDLQHSLQKNGRYYLLSRLKKSKCKIFKITRNNVHARSKLPGIMFMHVVPVSLWMTLKSYVPNALKLSHLVRKHIFKPFLVNIPINYTPWKHQNTKGFLLFSGGLKWVHWPETN